MDQILSRTLKILPKIWASYLTKKLFYTFSKNERIVRIIYSTYNINPTNKTLKANFFRFDLNANTNKKELSCIRFELETMDFCRLFGKRKQDPNYKRTYYGLACTTKEFIDQLDSYKLKFSPNLIDDPRNYFHCDLYDNYTYKIEAGEALPAEISYRLDSLKTKWKVNLDDGNLTHNAVLPISVN